MGYDATGMTEMAGEQFPYGVVIMEPDPDSNFKMNPDSIGKLVEVRLIMENPSQGPPTSSYDSHKIRYECKVKAGFSRGDLEAWLATEKDGMDISPPARDDILRLVYEGTDDFTAIGFDFWFDLFVPGKGRTFSSDNPFVYWLYESFGESESEEEEEEEEELEQDGRVDPAALQSLKWEKTTEEVGCGMCGVDKAEIGSMFLCLPCGHKFHGDCVAEWSCRHRFCPTCNFRLPMESYDDYPCVCTECLYFRDMGLDTVPRHPPPFYRFYNGLSIN